MKSHKTCEIQYNEDTCKITVNGKVVAEWDDDTVVDYPEDLVWRRDISKLFYDAFKAGVEYAIKNNLTKS